MRLRPLSRFDEWVSPHNPFTRLLTPAPPFFSPRAKGGGGCTTHRRPCQPLNVTSSLETCAPACPRRCGGRRLLPQATPRRCRRPGRCARVVTPPARAHPRPSLWRGGTSVRSRQSLHPPRTHPPHPLLGASRRAAPKPACACPRCLSVLRRTPWRPRARAPRRPPCGKRWRAGRPQSGWLAGQVRGRGERRRVGEAALAPGRCLSHPSPPVS